jgi:hypothetical protein
MLAASIGRHRPWSKYKDRFISLRRSDRRRQQRCGLAGTHSRAPSITTGIENRIGIEQLLRLASARNSINSPGKRH